MTAINAKNDLAMARKIVTHIYNNDEDFTSAMKFLYETYKRTNSYQNWFPDRFENSLGRGSGTLLDDIMIWEEVNDEAIPAKSVIVAMANSEGSRERSDYFIQIDPVYSFLEREILEWIEGHFLEGKKDLVNRGELRIHTLEGNPTRESLLAELGYKEGKISGYLRLRPANLPIPDSNCPKGFEIRSIRGRSDYDQLTSAVRCVFGHGEWFNAEAYEGITCCSFYKQDLDLVAVTPDGTFASFCTFRIDPISRITSLEPMGTLPSYRGLGLAKALIYEGLNRSMKYDPSLFYIGGAADTPAANHLYNSVGFNVKFAYHSWHKEIQ